MRRTAIPAPHPQTRLQRALTLFVLVATVLMALGTVVVAVYIYQPDLDFLSFFRPLGAEEGATQGTPLGELLAERVPLGTPGAGQESIGGPTIESGSAIQLTIEPVTCVDPSLTIGSTHLAIEAIVLQADGLLQLPAGKPGVVYWVNQSSPNNIFALGIDPGNQSLKDQIQVGDLATIFWEDCSAQSYHISRTETKTLEQGLTSTFDSAFTLLVPGNPTEEALIIHGVEEQSETQEYEIFQPRPEDLLASVIMGNVLAPEGSETIQVELSIQNYGVGDIRMLESDVGLFNDEGMQAAGLSGSEPALPFVLEPGQKQAFRFTFPRPPGDLGVLRVFNVEYNLEEFK